jgi:hypothetical protein
MTLREKFLPKMYCFFGSGMLTNSYDEKVAEYNAKQCEQILDENAIEFGKWLNNQVLKKKGSHYHLHNKMRVSELYIIYKKEKGL